MGNADENREERVRAPDSALLTAANVVAATREAAGSPCACCSKSIRGHDVVMSLVLGYRHTPHCRTCLAEAVGEDEDQLVARIYEYVKRRDCYHAGWEWADRQEGRSVEDPAASPEADIARPDQDNPADLQIAAAFDAGDMGCGDLVLELRLRMRALEPGDILRVTALDPGAPTDIPAWCGLTRHPLRAQSHPDYWIQRRSD